MVSYSVYVAVLADTLILFLIRIISWRGFEVSTAKYLKTMHFCYILHEFFKNGWYFDNEIMLKVGLGIRGRTFAVSWLIKRNQDSRLHDSRFISHPL